MISGKRSRECICTNTANRHGVSTLSSKQAELAVMNTRCCQDAMKQGSRQLQLPVEGAVVECASGSMGLLKPATASLTLMHPQLHATPPAAGFNGAAKASSFPIDTRAGRRAGMSVNKVGRGPYTNQKTTVGTRGITLKAVTEGTKLPQQPLKAGC